MKHFQRFLLVILLFCGISSCFGHESLNLNGKSTDKVTVAVSVREPFVVYDEKNKELKGMDITMLKEFGKKYRISMEFVKLNVKLNEIFSSENLFNNFTATFDIS